MATKKKTTSSKKASTSKKSTTKSTKSKKTTSASTAKKTTTKKVASATSKSKTAKSPAKKTVAKESSVFDRLNLWNWVLAALHAVQGFAVIFLSKSDSLFDITTQFVTLDELASKEGAPVLVNAVRTLGSVNLAYLVAAFFFMSALAHLIIATVYRKRYEAGLANGINRARWFEYGLSASTMMIAISMLAGVTDLSTLMLIFVGTAVMNLCGLIMEVANAGSKKPSWISYIVGSLAGLAPWVAVGIYFWGANQYGSGDIPTFVYWIYVSIFLFFMSFAVNMWLQYRGKGKWQDYLYGEKVYMILSLVAKSALAWQVFAGTLRP